MSSKNFTSWTDTKVKARELREAAGTQRTLVEEAAALEHLRAEVRAYRLAEVRKSQHLTQVEVAAAMGVGQPRVSQIERGDLDIAELPTLRKYIEALGGQLRVVADFGDTSLNLC
ncbi:helix-turn-helix domain-containing protein [Kitasatospora hibisci]|uniref:helix-turn-helix domain-containing protein n=1 Tax=Kitasatospora hibisci TaxID=3369522 RepID=UPI003754FE55